MTRSAQDRFGLVVLAVLGVLAWLPSSRPTHAQGTLALAYGFSEGAGSTTADSSAHGLSGTLVNGAAWTTAGRFGNGLTFDGENDRVEVPTSASLELTTAFTLEAWIHRSESGAGYQTLLIKENGEQPSYSLSLTSEGRVDLLVGLASGARSFSSVRLVPASTWTHVAATYDGNTARLWLNGIEDAAVAFTGSIVASAGPLRLGGDGTWWGHFAGRMDEVRIYSHALNAAAIVADMETPLSPSGPPLVTRVSPPSDALGVPVTTDVIATFGAPINAATVSGTTFELRNGAIVVAADVSYDATTRRARLLPDTALAHSTSYTATVRGGLAGVADAAGVPLGSDVTWSFSTAAPSSAPVAAYSFSEGSGTTTVDRSGNGHTGQVQGAGWSGDGRYGSALSFDGINDQVTIFDSDHLDLTTAFTLEMWVNRAEGGYQTLLIKENADLPPYSLSTTSDGRIDLLVRLASGNRSVSSATLVPANTWTHVAATYDSATARLWINGVEDAAVSFSGAIVTSIGPLRLGGDSIWFRPFAGRLDEVRLYSRALSASEIIEDMNSSIDDLTSPEVTSTTPGDGALDVNPGAIITATFSESVLASSINGATFVLREAGGTAVPGIVSYDDATRTATLDPTARLTNLTAYTATLEGGASGARVTDLAGNALASDRAWTFTTANAETTPPTIAARFAPPANSAGWHNGQVTITFECSDASGIATCPEAVTLTQEGAGQLIERTAVDIIGNEETASITLNIDRTPGSVAITAPAPGITTTDSSISLVATVTDALSGIGTAFCNGDVADVVSGGVECDAALRPGRNTLLVSILDLAGNSASAAVVVTRTVTPATLRVQPDIQTLTVNESRVLGAHTEDGTSPTELTWASSDPDVASVAADGIVTAHAAGEAVITAAAGSLSATATIQVVSSLMPGTLRWRSGPLPGFVSLPTIYANRVDDEGPDLFAVDTEAAGGFTLLRALRADGTQLWAEAAPATPLFGDTFGGVIGLVPSALPLWGKGIARFGGPPSAAPWRYDSEGYIRTVFAEGEQRHSIMQSPDSVVYAIERLDSPDGTTSNAVIALDGGTGALKFRVPLPTQRHRVHESATCPGSDDVEAEAWSGPLSADADGTVYVAAVEIEGDTFPTCDGQGNLILEQTHMTQTWQLHLLRITSTGAVARQMLWDHEFTTVLGPSEMGVWIQPATVVPDGLGGALVNWSHAAFGGSNVATLESRVTRALAGSNAEHTIASMQVTGSELFENFRSSVALSSDGTAYLKTSSTLKAVDVVSWSDRWTLATTGVPVVALDGGGVLVHDAGASSLIELDSDGAIVRTVSLGVVEPTSLLGGQGSIHGRDVSTLAASEFAFPEFCEAAFSFRLSGGSAPGQSQPRRCKTPPPSPNHKGLVPATAHTYRFVDSPGAAWTQEQRFAVEEAFLKWTGANEVSGLNTAFRPATDQDTPSLELRRRDLVSGGQAIPAQFLAPAPSANGTIQNGVIEFTTNQNVLSSSTGYLKAALHEIGHALGLFHTQGFRGSSVMNDFGAVKNGLPIQQRDDYLGNVPMDVTPCDRDAAKNYAFTRPWP